MENGSGQNRSAQLKIVQKKVVEDIDLWQRSKEIKTWKAKLPKAAALLDISVREREEAIRPRLGALSE